MKVKLTESKLKQIVEESVNNVIKEYFRDIDDDNYYGGGLPDSYFHDNDFVPDDDRISKKEINQLETIADTIANIANNTSDDTDLLYEAINCIEKFISQYKTTQP